MLCTTFIFFIITLPLRQWTVPLKSVNGYVRASKPFNQHLHPVKSQWLCNKSVVTFSFSRVVYISTQLQIKYIIQTVLFKQCFIANGRVFKMKVIQTICICHAESIALEFLKYNSCVVWSWHSCQDCARRERESNRQYACFNWVLLKQKEDNEHRGVFLLV